MKKQLTFEDKIKLALIEKVIAEEKIKKLIHDKVKLESCYVC